MFEAIGLPQTIAQAIGALPPGGTAVLVGLTRFGETASFEPFPFVDGGRRILGSNYGSAVAAVDFPRYAEAYLAGRLPIDRLIDRRLPLDDLEDAFDRLRAGEAARQMVMFGADRLAGDGTAARRSLGSSRYRLTKARCARSGGLWNDRGKGPRRRLRGGPGEDRRS